MVKKSVYLLALIGLSFFLLSSCIRLRDDVCDTNLTLHDEEYEIAENERSETYTENSVCSQDTAAIIDPLCINNRCLSICEILHVDGKDIPLCDIGQKFTFLIHQTPSPARYCYFGSWDGKIEIHGVVYAHWANPYDTALMRESTADMVAGSLTIDDNRIAIHGYGRHNHPWGVPDYDKPVVRITELTTTQWGDWGIQIFQYAGDVTLIGMPGSISQIPEFQEDAFLFPLEYHACGRENQYILYHELPESRLWNLLMGY